MVRAVRGLLGRNFGPVSTLFRRLPFGSTNMQRFPKLATGQSSRELLAQLRATEPRRSDGRPFRLLLAYEEGQVVLRVIDNAGEEAGHAHLLHMDGGFRATAKAIIGAYDQRKGGAA
jgi:hypothetical protein